MTALTTPTWQVPTRIVMAMGCLAGIGEESAALGSRAAVLVDPALREDPRVERVTASLRRCGVTITPLVPEKHPTTAGVGDLVAALGVQGCDHVLAVGGGSTMDAGKLCALASTNPNVLDDEPAGRRVIDLDDRQRERLRPGLPVLAVPTTSATGSEANTVAAVWHAGRKRLLAAGLMAPRTSMVDAELLTTLPPDQLAAGGAETFARLVCPYLCDDGALATTDALTEQLATSCLRATTRVLDAPEDLTALADLGWLVTISGTHLSNVGRPAWGHVLWYLQDCVSELSGAAKGPAMAALLGSYLHEIEAQTALGSRFGAPDRLERLASQLAPELGAADLVTAVGRRLGSWGLPRSLAELDLSADAVDLLARTALAEWGHLGRLDGVSLLDLHRFFARAWATPARGAAQDRANQLPLNEEGGENK